MHLESAIALQLRTLKFPTESPSPTNSERVVNLATMTSLQVATETVADASNEHQIPDQDPNPNPNPPDIHDHLQVAASKATSPPAEVNATLEVESKVRIHTPETIHKENANQYAAQDVDEGAVSSAAIELPHTTPPQVDATIQISQPDSLLGPVSLPANLPDFSQMGAIDSLLAYAEPFPPFDPSIYDNLPMAPHAPAAASQPYLEPSPYLEEHDETRVSAYAKLEFPDGEFYMNTYQLVMGRDQRAFRDALRREEDERRRIDEEASTTRDPKTPTNLRREQSRAHRSVVSESGGILRDGDDPTPGADREEKRRRRKASKKSKSTGSSSHHLSRRNSLAQPNGTHDYQAQPSIRKQAPTTNTGAAPVDPATLRPSPHDCPLVCIHPPATTSASGHKAISREHVRIAYNLKKHLFEAIILGRNGAFIDETFCYQDNVIPLKSGSILQIGGVVVRFVLPDVAIGETGAEHRGEYEDTLISERYSEGGKEMSFDFEESVREGLVPETSSDSSGDERQDEEGENRDVDSGDEIEEGEEEEDEMLDHSDQSPLGNEDEEQKELNPTTELNLDNSPKGEKKRGPGRPPKDGIMSKREQKLARKEAAAQALALAQNPAQNPPKAKKTVPKPEQVKTETVDGMDPAAGIPGVPTKNKVGRPRKHPRPDTPPIQREKRKYTKRKPKEPKEGEAKEEGEGGEEVKEKKEKKPTKPPRSPSPTFNEADLTPEQLAKPQANYVTLIHEALSSSAAGMMSLPQIYRAIMRKYPFFVLKCSTTGWQSSVRHNLSQHHAFKKVERDGKGWMWAIVEGVSIEKEKKRRTTPPPQLPHGQMHHQPIYQAGHPPHMMPGQYPMPPPGYMLHPSIRPGQPYMGPPPPINGHPYPHGPPLHMNPHPHLHQHPPPGFMPSIPQIAAITAPQQYSSPYAPKPTTQPPPPPPPPNGQQQHLQEQAPQHTSHDPSQQPPHQSPQHPPPQFEQRPPGDPKSMNPSPVSSGMPVMNHNNNPLPPYPSQQPMPPQQYMQQQPMPPHHPVQQQPVPTLPSRPQHPPSVISAVETFRANLLSTLKDKTDNAEAILASAVNRVLGYISQSAVPGDHFEPQIMEALKSVLSKVPEYRAVQLPSSAQSTSQLNDNKPPQPQINQEGQRSASQQPSKLAGPEKSAPSVMRPSFAGGVSRPPSASVPRPPMNTPGVVLRTESGSPANNTPARLNGPSSASPVVVPSNIAVNGVLANVSNGANAPAPIVSEDASTQIAGQKRPLEDADDMPEFKRIATSGPPQLKA